MKFEVTINMEKNEFPVLIKQFFLREKNISKTKTTLDKYYGESVPLIKMILNGLPIFVVVVRAQVMPSVQGAQIRLPLQK